MKKTSIDAAMQKVVRQLYDEQDANRQALPVPLQMIAVGGGLSVLSVFADEMAKETDEDRTAVEILIEWGVKPDEAQVLSGR